MKLEFTVGTETWKVPDYIDIKTFEKAIVWDLGDLNNLKPFVATILGCPLNVLMKLDEEVLAFITGVCLQKVQLQNSECNLRVEEHDLIDFDEISFGQFIDLDTYISKGAGVNLSKITEILYNAKGVGHWPVELVWGALQEWNRFRTEIYKQYDEFFELSDNDTNPVDEDDAPEANIQLMWWEAIMALAGEDFMKIHQVVERPYKEALNYLTWKKAKVQKEKLQILKQKNDLQRRAR